jgi:hypothetical protein
MEFISGETTESISNLISDEVNQSKLKEIPLDEETEGKAAADCARLTVPSGGLGNFYRPSSGIPISE